MNPKNLKKPKNPKNPKNPKIPENPKNPKSLKNPKNPKNFQNPKNLKSPEALPPSPLDNLPSKEPPPQLVRVVPPWLLFLASKKPLRSGLRV